MNMLTASVSLAERLEESAYHWLNDLKSPETLEAIVGHAFITLTWNLVCHSKNTVNINPNHISWYKHALAILFGHTKTDVEGF